MLKSNGLQRWARKIMVEVRFLNQADSLAYSTVSLSGLSIEYSHALPVLKHMEYKTILLHYIIHFDKLTKPHRNELWFCLDINAEMNRR